MKKLLILILAVSFLLTACVEQKILSQFSVAKKTETNITGNYLGSYYQGNYVWGGAMNLAWTELNENILQEKLQLKTDNKITLEMVNKLNNPVFTKDDLNEESYYIKSGYGQETVSIINRESKEKFPEKSFSDLKIDLNPTDVISYAYFLKEVEYETEFEQKDVFFAGQKVKGFYAQEESQKRNIGIIKYENDNKFIISLRLKNEDDQLILAKGYEMTDPQAVVDEVNENNKDHLATIDKSDRFEAPKLQLDYNREYSEITEKFLANQGFEQYLIAQMFENIKFDMDEKGARVENQAAISMLETAMLAPKQTKNFILDEPYWVIMKRSDSQNPYFILGVNNIELMEEN